MGPDKNNTCVIVVTYQPDMGLPLRVKNILDQTKNLIIVDNGSSRTSVEMLLDLSLDSEISLVLNAENLGVATAFNQGIRAARDRNFLWVLLLDQDSSPIPTMVDLLLAVYRDYPAKNMLAVIGTNFLDSGIIVPVVDRTGWVEKKTVITSGSLISICMFNRIGLFRDDYFIDLVDHEFCLRARSKGFSIIETISPLMSHSIGNYSLHRFLLRTYRSSNHSPIRHYYMMRNYIYLAKEYLFYDPFWLMFLAFVRLREFVLVVFFEQDKLEKIRLMCLGLWHGILGTVAGGFSSR